MNFWTEKQQSGEGLNNAEDAKKLMEDLNNMEGQMVDIEIGVAKLGITN